MRFAMLGVTALLVTCCLSKEEISANPARTLFLLEELSMQQSYSSLVQSLENRGHIVTVLRAEDASLKLWSSGQRAYENMLVFAPRADYIGSFLDTGDVMKFVDGGGNLILAASPDASEFIREVVAEFGFDMDEDEAHVQDHFLLGGKDDESRTRVLCSDVTAPPTVLSRDNKTGPFLFEGTGFVIAQQNPLVLPLLRAPSTSYLYQLDKPIGRRPLSVGTDTLLIAALQARSGARIVVTGSMAAFSDDYMDRKVSIDGGETETTSGNRVVMDGAVAWACQDTGVLSASPLLHRSADGSEGYLAGQELHVSVEIEERVNGAPLIYAPSDPVFVELRLYGTVVRKRLQNHKNGTLSAVITLPDEAGVYRLEVNHQPSGYTPVILSEEIVVAPLPSRLRPRSPLSTCAYLTSAVSLAVLLGAVAIFDDKPAVKQE